MARKSIAHDALREKEILDACAKLYETKGFHDITIKDISQETSLSRPSIYNYFDTKEEIFLGLLKRETDQWTQDLLLLRDQHQSLTKDALISALGSCLQKRKVMLKICGMNIYEIEDHSRLSRLATYKQTFKEAFNAFRDCLKKFLPELSDTRLEEIRSAFYPFMNGIYPYVYPTEKQLEAMHQVGLSSVATSIDEMTESFLKQILHP